MAQGGKFTILVKPSFLDRYWGSDFIDYAYYTRYIRDARLMYVRDLGLEWPRDRVLMVIKEENTYSSPLRVEEEMRIYVRQTKIGKTSAITEFQIDEAGSGRPIAHRREIAVWMDRKTGRPAPTPEEWKKAIITFEGESNIEVMKD